MNLIAWLISNYIQTTSETYSYAQVRNYRRKFLTELKYCGICAKPYRHIHIESAMLYDWLYIDGLSQFERQTTSNGIRLGKHSLCD